MNDVMMNEWLITSISFSGGGRLEDLFARRSSSLDEYSSLEDIRESDDDSEEARSLLVAEDREEDEEEDRVLGE